MIKYKPQCDCNDSFKVVNPKFETDIFSHKIGADKNTAVRCVNCGKYAEKIEHQTKEESK